MTSRGPATGRVNHTLPRPGNGKIRIAYILSASHSGSTLLAMLLNAHPEICTVGELKVTALGDVGRYRCSCRRLIGECPFWDRVSTEMAARGLDFSVANPGTDFRTGASPYVLKLLQPLYRGGVLEQVRGVLLRMSPRWRAQLPRIQMMNSALMSAVLAQTKKEMIVDSSKIGLRLKLLLENPRLDIKIIRLIRDGRAVSLSYMDPAAFADSRNEALRGGGSGGDRRSERLPMDLAAREWRRSNEEAEALLSRVDRAKWVAIRYEELCQDPQKTLKEIFSFLEVGPEDRWRGFRTVEHHIIGNGMRLDASNEIELDERWKRVLTVDDLEAFEQEAGRTNRLLGYA